MPLILSGNVASAVAGAYEVANSCRFNDGDSPSMYKSGLSGGSTTIATISAWIKRCTLGTDQRYYANYAGSSSDRFQIGWQTDDQLYIQHGSSVVFKTNRKFRDVSAWYNIVVAVDSSQASNDNRVKVYVNGTQETSFATFNTMTQDTEIFMNNDKIWIGQRETSSLYFDGYLAEVVQLDGTAANATSFGEFDEDSPTIWKPKDVSGLTFGTNGFYLDFEDSSNLGNDANSGTDLTEANLAATDQATDTPTNNFCTMNPLIAPTSNASTFSEGNCKIVTSTGGNFGAVSTHGVSSGKWYFEVKFVAEGSSNLGNISLCSSENGRESARTNQHANQFPSEAYPSFTYEYDGNVYKDSGGSGTAFGSYSTGDIIIMALDLDNSKAYFGVNGTWGNSSDPTSGATGTGALSVTAADFWHLQVGDRSEGNTATYEINFGGCPAFSISSGNSDANGYGNFEYAVPSGYLALCTKNLGSDGG